MKKLLIAAALAVLGATGANAADMAPRTYTNSPPPITAPIYDWSGFYIGGGIGGEWDRSNSSVTTALVGTPPFDIFTNGGSGSCTTQGCPNGLSMNSTSFRSTLYAGYNWQFSPSFVGGIEADVGYANAKQTRNGSPYPAFLTFGIPPSFFGFPLGTTPGGGDSFSVQKTWDGSARLRAGFLATPSTLFYLTGGAAWADIQTTSTCSTVPGPVLNCAPDNYITGTLGQPVAGHSVTRLGWTVGGGVEAMISPNWILRGEYRYTDYGNFGNTDVRTCTGCNAASNPLVISYSTHVWSQTATIGIAYKFGGPSVARY